MSLQRNFYIFLHLISRVIFDKNMVFHDQYIKKAHLFQICFPNHTDQIV